MTPASVVLERGVSLRFVTQRWHFQSGAAIGGDGYGSLPEALAALAPLQVIVIAHEYGSGAARPLLLRTDGRTYYGIKVSGLMQRPLDAAAFFPLQNLTYLLEGANYHCIRLAGLYSAIAAEYYRIQQIPGMGVSSGTGIFGNQTEPYHEFEALISVARRTYDTMRFLLWNRFGKGTVPRSLEALLSAESKLPEGLRDRLQTSWDRYGLHLTAYRDCIQHYVPVDFRMASAFMRRHDSGAWTTTMRIPDNPEARSQRRFTFAKELDALNFGWRIADEVLGVVTFVVESIFPAADA